MIPADETPGRPPAPTTEGWTLHFEAEYRAHYVALARLAGLLLSDRHAGEEVAQEAFARFLMARRRVDDPAAYLRTSVLNLCRSRLRRLRVARRHPPVPEPAVAGPEEATRSIASHARLVGALGQLPVRQREAVVLRYYLEMTEKEMADCMGVSTGAVKTHLHRGLEHLADLMEDLR